MWWRRGQLRRKSKGYHARSAFMTQQTRKSPLASLASYSTNPTPYNAVSAVLAGGTLWASRWPCPSMYRSRCRSAQMPPPRRSPTTSWSMAWPPPRRGKLLRRSIPRSTSTPATRLAWNWRSAPVSMNPVLGRLRAFQNRVPRCSLHPRSAFSGCFDDGSALRCLVRRLAHLPVHEREEVFYFLVALRRQRSGASVCNGSSPLPQGVTARTRCDINVSQNASGPYRRGAAQGPRRSRGLIFLKAASHRWA